MYKRRISIAPQKLTLLACLALTSASQSFAATTALRFAGQNVEVVISEVSSRTVRLQVAPLDGKNNPRAATPSTILVPFPVSEKFRARTLSGDNQVRVGQLRVTIKPMPLTITVQRADGKPVQELVFDAEGGTNAAVTFRAESHIYGLGEGAQQFDRRGALYPMEPSWGAWNRPLLGSVVPSPFLIGTEGWAMLAHRPEGMFDLRGNQGKFIPRQQANVVGALDLFVVSVDDPADALTEYDRLTGKPVMPPRWALGYFQSHRTLAGPEEAFQIAATFRQKSLPIDAVIYLGTGYCTNGWNTAHGSLTFNPNAFSNPAQDLAALHNLNLKVVLHINAAPRNLFGNSVTETSTAPNHIANYWARHHDVFAMGVDGWWPDDGDELPLEARLTRHRVYYEGSLLDRPDVRPWSLHRTGYAGVQRYGGWIWSGDIDGKWATLAAHISVGLNHSLSLTPFWGTDTGGFYPSRELTGELYTRWLQFSAFTPLFRSHGRTWKLRLPWGWDTGEFGPQEHPANQHPDRSELHNAEVEPIARKYMELRYRMLPYNYTLMREASDTGVPPMRALWLHYPNDQDAVKLGDEYLWGRDILVAPVVEKGAKSRNLYLPAGSWRDWWTGVKLEGKQWIERPVDLTTMPLYVRAGAIIPLDPVRQYTAQPVTGATTLRVHPGANGDFTLYDDDGESLGYKNASDPKAVWIHFHWDDSSRRLTIEPDARMKKWPGGKRMFSVETSGSTAKAKQVEFSGTRVIVNL